MKHAVLTLILLTLLANIACTSSNSIESASANSPIHCTEVENPYDEGTGHYAGFEWAQNNGATSCGGSSDSFIEGCEEYQRQESEYAECEAKKNR
jgi:hypothetical protein